MSKKWLKGFKKPKTEVPAPRLRPAIDAEFTSICAEIGQAKYKIAALESQVNASFARINELSAESNERAKLDAEVKQEVEQTPSGAV